MRISVLCNLSSCTSYESRTIHATLHFLAMGKAKRERYRISPWNYSFHLRYDSQLEYEDVKVDKAGSKFSACDFKKETEMCFI